MKSELASYLDLQDPLFVKDPYPTYARIREQSSLFQYAAGHWLATGWRAAHSILSDASFETTISPSDHTLGGGVVFLLEASEHEWLRGLLAKVVSQRVSAIRGQIASIADELAASAASHEQIDLVTDFARPLPLAVLATLLGIE